MNESLRITYNPEPAEQWVISYHLSLPTPGGPQEDTGWGQVDTSEEIDAGYGHLGPAVEAARVWAADSGYKAGPSKINPWGSTVDIKLSRP